MCHQQEVEMWMMIASLVPTAHAADCSATEAVRAFAVAADQREVATLEKLLHPEFRVLFTMPGVPEPSVLTRQAWFAMLAEGKIGGVPRTLTLATPVAAPGAITTVSATLRGASGEFQSTFTVVRGTSGCRIVQDSLSFTPPAK